MLLWVPDGAALPSRAVAHVQWRSNEQIEVQVSFAQPSDGSSAYQTIRIHPPTHTELLPGHDGTTMIAFVGQGTAAQPLMAKVACFPTSDRVTDGGEGDSMGLLALPSHLTSCVCAQCQAPLLVVPPSEQGRRLLPLPAAGWEELVDAWMCHEDQLINRTVQRGKDVLYPNRDGVHQTAHTLHANTLFVSEFWIVPKCSDLRPGAIRWEDGNKVRLSFSILPWAHKKARLALPSMASRYSGPTISTFGTEPDLGPLRD